MRPLRIVRPPPGRGVRGVLAPALDGDSTIARYGSIH